MLSQRSSTLIMSLPIKCHQYILSCRGTIAVLSEAQRKCILRPTWKRELDLEPLHLKIITDWASGTDYLQLNKRQNQQRVRSAGTKVNVTSRVHTTLSLPMAIVPTLCPPFCPSEPRFDTTPLMSLGWVK